MTVNDRVNFVRVNAMYHECQANSSLEIIIEKFTSQLMT